MGQFDWEEDLHILVGNAQVSGHFKGGVRKAATLPEVISRLIDMWEEELRDGDFRYFTLELIDGNGNPVPGKTQLVVCKGEEHAEVIAENLLGEIDKPETSWRCRGEWVR